MYGSSRLGVEEPKVAWKYKEGFSSGLFQNPFRVDSYIPQAVAIGSPPSVLNVYYNLHLEGHKRYEISNHLGNVMAVITDRKRGFKIPTSGIQYAYYRPAVLSATDYYAFGMEMPGRAYSAGAYRYGFNGKENDRGNFGLQLVQDYGMRLYNPALGKFLSVDPIAKQYPELTPYQFASNRPIDGIDQDGLEWKPVYSDGKPVAFQWAGKEGLNSDGKIKSGYYEAAILFQDHDTWTKGTYDTKKDRWKSKNIGSATAIVYGKSGMDDIKEFPASTLPSDPDKFATIQEGIYQAVHWKHKGDYPALQLRKDSDISDNKIPTIGQNPSHLDKDYAVGVNVHKAGKANYTGTLWKKGKYHGCSEGCQLISNSSKWNDFIKMFDNVSKIGVVVNREKLALENPLFIPLEIERDNTKVLIPRLLKNDEPK